MTMHEYVGDAPAPADSVEAPVSVSHLIHTLGAYRAVIVMSMIGVAIAYLIVALALYLTAPAQRTTSQPFRLDFQGANEGTYPNGVKFSTSEIVSVPVLIRVFSENDLRRFTSFDDFSKSVVVLMSNLAYERIASEYQSLLSDPRLSPIDRERIQRDWEARLQAASKNDFSINYLRDRRNMSIPEPVVRKVLVDVLNAWAAFAIRDRHVLEYRLAVLSPNVISTTQLTSDPLINITLLRTNLYRVLDNIADLRQIPGSDLIRTQADHVSLAELQLRIEQITRFELEPLASAAAQSSGDRESRSRFLQDQLAYDQRALKAAQDRADAIRQAMIIYSSERNNGASNATPSGAIQKPRTSTTGTGETVMPQLSESFIDRLMTLANEPTDMKYRQKLVDDYRTAAEAVIPAEQAVSYDQQLLNDRSPRAATLPVVSIQNQFVSASTEARQLITKVNEIFQSLSRNLNPATELYSLTAPPVTMTQRASSVSQMRLYGLLTLLIALPVIVVICLIHNRLREEDNAERLMHHEA